MDIAGKIVLLIGASAGSYATAGWKPSSVRNEEGKTKPETAQRNILVVRHYHIRSPNRRFGELMHQHNRPV